MLEIQSIETSTHTYFGEGLAMHNTTNYIERLPPRMLRPGRFDKKIFIGYPSYESRLAYLKHKLRAMEVTDAKLVEMAKQTSDMGFGHLRELIAGVYALNEPLAEVLKRLRAMPVQESAKVSAVAKSILG
jgi:ATP-dependent 26S proteasome regulatory subunit